MARNWKYWLAAAPVLLTIGAGCVAAVPQGASVRTGAEAPSQEGAVNVKLEAEADDVDAAVDAALKEADAEASVSTEENADAGVVSDDSAELNAYGQAYEPSKL